jgi:cytidylate kinase
MTVVAMSAAYGAGGSIVGPALARRLDVPFVDRAIAAAVADRLDVSVDEALRQWEPPDKSLVERMLSNFLGADTGAPVAPPPNIVTADDFRRATEAAVVERAATGEGVILGRGAVAVLREDPRVLRVRLSGSQERRLAQAVRVGGLEEDQAAHTMRHLDRYHAEYLRRFYGADIDDPTLYHLSIDATALHAETCVDLIELAARALS